MKKTGTLCYLIKNRKILLAYIIYPDGAKWNGVGGFVEAGESSQNALLRELEEEIGVLLDPTHLTLHGRYSVNPNLKLDIYTATVWDREPQIIDPTISRLEWFTFANIPYSTMHAETKNWLPKIIKHL